MKRTWQLKGAKKIALPVLLLSLLLMGTVLLLLAWKGLLPGMGQRLTILMYHHLVPTGKAASSMTVTEERFRQDLGWLRDHGYTTVLPRELKAGKPLPRKAVMITFDDGYASNYTYAFPLLREFRMKAAIALVGRIMDSGDPQFLTWDMCREMHNSGLVEFGSHSYDLHNLDERDGMYVEGGSNGIQRLQGEERGAYEARVSSDLTRSQEQIEKELGNSVLFFAYPFGATEPWADEWLQKNFDVTVTTKEGTANLSKGTYQMPRKTITMEHSAEDCLSLWDFLRDVKHAIWEHF